MRGAILKAQKKWHCFVYISRKLLYSPKGLDLINHIFGLVHGHGIIEREPDESLTFLRCIILRMQDMATSETRRTAM